MKQDTMNENQQKDKQILKAFSYWNYQTEMIEQSYLLYLTFRTTGKNNHLSFLILITFWKIFYE